MRASFLAVNWGSTHIIDQTFKERGSATRNNRANIAQTRATLAKQLVSRAQFFNARCSLCGGSGLRQQRGSLRIISDVKVPTCDAAMEEHHETNPSRKHPGFVHLRSAERGPACDAGSNQGQYQNGAGKRPRRSYRKQEQGKTEDKRREAG